MKKIIAAFDGLRFSESTLSYALTLSKAGGAQLVGLFLEDPYIHGYGIRDLMRTSKGSLSKERRRLDKLDAKTRAQAIKRFQQACEKAGVLTELRRRDFYEKPTQERKRKKAAAVKRHMNRVSRDVGTPRTRMYGKKRLVVSR